MDKQKYIDILNKISTKTTFTFIYFDDEDGYQETITVKANNAQDAKDKLLSILNNGLEPNHLFKSFEEFTGAFTCYLFDNQGKQIAL